MYKIFIRKVSLFSLFSEFPVIMAFDLEKKEFESETERTVGSSTYYSCYRVYITYVPADKSRMLRRSTRRKRKKKGENGDQTSDA